MEPISNARVKLIKNLKFKKSRYKHGLFVVEGIKFVKEVLRSNFEIKFICIQEEKQDKFRKILDLAGSNVPILGIPSEGANELFSTCSPQGIITVVKIPEKFFYNDKVNEKVIFEIAGNEHEGNKLVYLLI